MKVWNSEDGTIVELPEICTQEGGEVGWRIRPKIEGFIEEVEGLLLAAGLRFDRPELMGILPPCEKDFIQGSDIREICGVLWDKAQALRLHLGLPEADEDKRACMGSGRCKICEDPSEGQKAMLMAVCAQPRFHGYWEMKKKMDREDEEMWK